jgi:dipeptidyl aminopeptidase/acylaminoacyl peptidase
MNHASKVTLLTSLCLLAFANKTPAAPATPVRAVPQATLSQFLSYPFTTQLVSAQRNSIIGWVETLNGVRNIWVADGPSFEPRRITSGTADDGQELTGLAFAPDGSRIVWVRGGDHDANWAAAGNLQPNPTSSTEQPHLTIWSAATTGGAPVRVAEGDSPTLSSSGRLAFVKDNQAWVASPDGTGTPHQLFFDRGHIQSLTWSPDGSRLAFVSYRSDHSFVGIYSSDDQPILWLAPSSSMDETPVWSPDGHRIAFTRRQWEGPAYDALANNAPRPWAIRVADTTTGTALEVWHSPNTPEGSFPALPDGVGLDWGAGDRLVFRAEMDGWGHLYSVPAIGGTATLLTPGHFLVEHVCLSQDRRWLLYSANEGALDGDDGRRHVFRVAVDRPGPIALTSGTGLQWTPIGAGKTDIAFVAATATAPPRVHVATLEGNNDRALSQAPTDFQAAWLTVPKPVTFRSADGLTLHGQLFDASGGQARKPGVIFVHGGPPRQMLLGWSYMEYYSNAYAVNQYLASRGFVVLSVNYRLGIGYGRAFQHAADVGAHGASEYRDVLAGAHFLQGLPAVDANRLGIWGGSYGGFLTALALARDSATFKAGVDWHGVHDWTSSRDVYRGSAGSYDEKPTAADEKLSFESSPVADVSRWKSPVLLIQGDDDRNVHFRQMVELANRLDRQGVAYEELVFPNEIHDFLRHDTLLKADAATADFLERQLQR